MISENRFVKGLNKDVEPKTQPPDTYRDAVNVDLIGNGDFFALTNIKGTTFVTNAALNVGLGSLNILGAFEVRGNFDYGAGVQDNPAILIFARVDANTSKIIAIDLKTPLALDLITDATGVLNFSTTGSIDASYLKDRGDNIVYFADHENEYRKVIVKWTTGASPPSGQTLQDLTVRPLAPIDDLRYNFFDTDGQLPAGTYQFAYQYFNSTNFKRSSWSLLTNPIPVIDVLTSSPPADTDEILGGTVGHLTNKSITLELHQSPAASIAALFDKVVIGVVKNNTGSKVPETVAYTLTPIDISFTAGVMDIKITGAEGETSIDIGEIVIEDAPILTFKTLEQKDNIMFGGNVKYNDLLDFDNGDPTFTDAETITEAVEPEGAYKFEGHTVLNRGYFRDEVYRFGITYQDKFGNWSPVQPFDFSAYQRLLDDTSRAGYALTLPKTYNANEDSTTVYTPLDQTSSIFQYDLLKLTDVSNTDLGKKVISVTFAGGYTEIKFRGSVSFNPTGLSFLLGDSRNHADSGVPDWKFPARDVSDYSLLDDEGAPFTATVGKANILGLKISNIRNHPSWAVGFAIVRMKRQKNILFQTPHIPTCAIQATRTAGNWSTDDSYDASNDCYYVKKHGMGTARNIAITNIGLIETGMPHYACINYVQDIGSGYTDFKDVPPLICAIPPEYMYNDDGTPYDDSYIDANLQIRVVDAVLWERAVGVDNTASPISLRNPTNMINANVYKALHRSQYYYNREGYIADNVVNKYYEKIKDLPWFAIVAKETSNVKEKIAVVNANAPVALPSIVLPNNSKYRNIIKYNDCTALSQQQGVDAVPAGSTTLFGSPVETQRALLLRLEDKIEDLSFRAFSYRPAPNSLKIFPLYTADYIDTDVYSDSYFNDNGLIWIDAWVATPEPHVVIASIKEQFVANGGQATSAAYILNVEKGLGDGRYGDLDNEQQYIYTGHYQPLEPSDISGNTPFDVEVYGGDCFITKSTIKICDGHVRTVVFDPDEDQLSIAGHDYAQVAGTSKTGSYTNFVEILEYFVETEVNTAYQSQKDIYPEIADNAIGTYTADYNYPFNFGYSAQNENKTFLSENKNVPNLTEVPARIQYSDQKVLQTAIEGFNRFRLLNFKDLEETYGGITKLIKTSDAELYSIQESAVRYIPVGKDIVEYQDGTQQIIGKQATIGNTVLYLSTESGCQHIRTVASSGDRVFFLDAQARGVNMFESKSRVQAISDAGMYSYFKDNLLTSDPIPEYAIMGSYDDNKKEYVLAQQAWDGSRFIVVYSDMLSVWKTLLDIGAFDIEAFVYSNQQFYGMCGKDAGGGLGVVLLEEMHTNNVRGSMFSGGGVFPTERDSTFQLVFNDKPNFAKTFDVLTLNSNERIDTGRLEVVNESALTPNQIASNLDFDIDPRQGKYYVNKIRDDSRNGRLRGQYAIGDFTIDNATDKDVSIHSMIMNYRTSERNY